MVERDLKKLSRTELLEILLEQSRQLEAVQQELADTKGHLQDRRLELTDAGSIAEAAIQINGVFEAAQAAADQYLENIRQLAQEREALCAKAREEGQQEAQRLLEETKQTCKTMEEETGRKCLLREQIADRVCRNRKKEAEAYWETVSERLQKFYDDHAGLQEMLSAMPK